MTERASFRYYKTRPDIIRLAVMLYVRFPLSLWNVEDLLHERGIEISHETVRFWWNRFGPLFASEIRRKRASRMRGYSNWQWHLDEVFVRINGETHYLWRAVEHEGEVLESYVTKRRDRNAELRFLRKSMKRYGNPEVIVTDKPRSYGAAVKVIGNADRQETGRWLNNRAENSHLPFRRRERAMLRFRQMRCLQKFAAVHSSIHNHFNQERALYSRDNFKLNRAAALAEWRALGAGASALSHDGKWIDVAAKLVEVVDRMGTGDTFNAGVLANLCEIRQQTKGALDRIKDYCDEVALDFGARFAAITISRSGATSLAARTTCANNSI